MKSTILFAVGLTMTLTWSAPAIAITLQPGVFNTQSELLISSIHDSNGNGVEKNLVLPEINSFAPSTRSSEDEDGVWVVAGTGKMTDFIFAQHYGLEGVSFEVNFEKNLNNPNTFRISEPYKNWNDPRIAANLTYNPDEATPMVFHVAYDNFVWFDEFETGYTIINPPSEAPYSGTVSVISSAYRLLESNGENRLDLILDMVPGFFSKLSGRSFFSLPATAYFGSDEQYTIMMGIDVGEETYEGTKWYFPANRYGEFNVVLSDELNYGNTGSDEGNWNEIGEGIYTDVIFPSLFSGIEPQQIPVVFEQNAKDPNCYRIKAPYANWENPHLSQYVSFDADATTPMVFHVVDNKYVWFEDFYTGLYLNYREGSTNIKGEIMLIDQADSFSQTYGIEFTVGFYPSLLCSFQNGNITLDAFTFLTGKPIYNILFKIDSTNYRGNTKGDFLVKLPGADVYNANFGWKSLGNAKFTDAFTYIINDIANYNLSDADLYQSWNVELQQNIEDPTLYRLVNPYKGWNNVYPKLATYDSNHNYYIYIYTLPESQRAAVNVFYTGITVEGFGDFGVYNDLGSVLVESGIYTAFDMYPTLFGTFQDNILTFPAEFMLEDTVLASFYGWFGYLSANPTFYYLNEESNFKVVFPSSGIESINYEDSDIEPLYYNLQGMQLKSPEKGQIVIMKKGLETKKVMVKE